MTIKKTKKLYPAGESIKKFINTLSFGEYIRLLQEGDDVTQVELALRLGISKQFVSAVETGKETVGLDFAKRVADALGYSLALFAKILLNEQLKKYDKNLEVGIRSKKTA